MPDTLSPRTAMAVMAPSGMVTATRCRMPAAGADPSPTNPLRRRLAEDVAGVV